jgi:SAM-dependent methyltransferase
VSRDPYVALDAPDAPDSLVAPDPPDAKDFLYISTFHQRHLTNSNIMSKQFWDDRYSKEAFAYGEGPNSFLQHQLPSLDPGRILFPAEGEGRNAVYAASLGWEAIAFDISTAGRLKAEMLAQRTGIRLEYHIESATDFNYGVNTFDAVALIYSHFTSEVKVHFHRRIQECLKPGGTIIIEVFSRDNLEYQKVNPYVGGPSDPEMLYSVDEVIEAFKEVDFQYIEQPTIELHEGIYHNGVGSVVRAVGTKKKPSR